MKIQKLHSTVAQAAAVPALFQSEGVSYSKVQTINWAEYPYLPFFEVAIAHDGDNILIHYRVSEQTSRAAAGQDNGHVWEDSCVEFFCCPNPSDGIYYNFECNCIGRVLLANGASRHNREYADADVLSTIRRWASIGDQPFEERACGPWEVALIIPRTAFFRHEVQTLDGATMSANVYKCGDLLQTPHFVSLFPISVPNPDFHRPDFFQPIDFE